MSPPTRLGTHTQRHAPGTKSWTRRNLWHPKLSNYPRPNGICIYIILLYPFFRLSTCLCVCVCEWVTQKNTLDLHIYSHILTKITGSLACLSISLPGLLALFIKLPTSFSHDFLVVLSVQVDPGKSQRTWSVLFCLHIVEAAGSGISEMSF